jgi:hypothetical protein
MRRDGLGNVLMCLLLGRLLLLWRWRHSRAHAGHCTVPRRGIVGVWGAEKIRRVLRYCTVYSLPRKHLWTKPVIQHGRLGELVRTHPGTVHGCRVRLLGWPTRT